MQRGTMFSAKGVEVNATCNPTFNAVGKMENNANLQINVAGSQEACVGVASAGNGVARLSSYFVLFGGVVVGCVILDSAFGRGWLKQSIYWCNNRRKEELGEELRNLGVALNTCEATRGAPATIVAFTSALPPKKLNGVLQLHTEKNVCPIIRLAENGYDPAAAAFIAALLPDGPCLACTKEYTLDINGCVQHKRTLGIVAVLLDKRCIKALETISVTTNATTKALATDLMLFEALRFGGPDFGNRAEDNGERFFAGERSVPTTELDKERRIFNALVRLATPEVTALFLAKEYVWGKRPFSGRRALDLFNELCRFRQIQPCAV